ncbi:MAG TPA: DUF5668 domain-containing protein [Acidobacteriota bacterium]|nr:DUF5668 domain-containing protein [Acidobacteriota bacterium]
MSERRASIFTPQLILGLLVVAAGVLFTMETLGMAYAWDYLRFWPLALVIVGVLFALQADQVPGRLGGGLLAAIGFALLINTYWDFRLDLWDFWPLVLVFLGGMLIWQALQPRKDRPGDADSESWITSMAVLGGVERKNSSSDFRGGELTAFMGGIEIDLSKAQITAPEAVLHIFAMWGGVNVRVPDDWTVVVEGFPFMGGYADKTHHPRDGVKQRLIVRGAVIMGGAEIKN